MLHGAWALAITLALQTPPSADPRPQASDASAPVEFFRALGHDIKAIGTRNSGTIALVGTISTLAVHPQDDSLGDWAADAGDSSYSRLGSVIGDAWLQGGAALGTYLVGVVSQHEQTRVVGGDLVRGQVLNGIFTRTLKAAVDRKRPDGGRYAFPSGHASAAFVSAAVLERHFGWEVGAPAYAVAGFVAWTRVRDSQHWLSDVVAGATLGTIVGRAVASRASSHAWAVVPTVKRRSVAVYVTRVP